MDTNIDTLTDSNHNKTNKITPLHTLLQEQLNNLNLTQHNNKHTHIPLHRSPSCIDHIFLNIPNKLINTTTHKNINSDHSYLTTTYMTNEPIYTPKFIEIRDNKQLTRQNLKNLLRLNDNFNNITNLTHPNEIAANLQLELNTVIYSIALPKIVHYSKKSRPKSFILAKYLVKINSNLA